MKRVFIFFILLSLFSNNTSAQTWWPIDLPIGNGSSMVYQQGAAGARIGYQYIDAFADTTAANNYQVTGSLAGFLKRIPGFCIRVADSIFMRSNDSTKWVNQTPLGGGGSTGWSLTGNAGTNPASNFIGTTDAQKLVIRTDNAKRFTINTSGAFGLGTGEDYGTAGYVLSTQGSSTAPTWVDPSSLYPTWQQTLDVSSILNKDNAIDGGAFNLNWNNNASFSVYTTSIAGLINDNGTATTQITVSNNEVQLKALKNSVINNESDMVIDADSIAIRPHQGHLNIDTLNAQSNASDSMLVWAASGSNRGQVGYRAIPSGGGTNIYNSDGTLTGGRIMTTGSNPFTIRAAGADTLFFIDRANLRFGFGDVTGLGNATGIHIDDAIGTIRLDANMQLQGLNTQDLSAATNVEFPIFYNSGNQYLTTGTGVDSIWRPSADSIRFRVRSAILSNAGTFGIYAPTSGISGSGTLNYVPKWTPNGTTLGNSLMYSDASGIGINNTSPLAPLHVGSQNVNNSVDAMILTSRVVTGAGNAHAFADATNFQKDVNMAYNSFDARITMGGSVNHDHYAAFQAAPTFAGTGTVSSYYGLYSLAQLNAGATVTNSFNVNIANATGSGSISGTQYGLYVEDLTKGSANYAIYTVGNARARFGGQIDAIQTINGTTALFTGDVRVGSSGYFYWNARSGLISPSDGVIQLQNNATTNFDRLQWGGSTSSFFSIARSGTNAIVCLADATAGAGLGVGMASATGVNSSAILEASSTTKGFLPPRMTATQGSSISSPATGLMIYVTDTNGTFTAIGWWGYNGSSWQQF